METYAAFVWADSHIMLYAICHIGLDIAFVIHPRNAECKNTIRNAKTLNQVLFFKFGMCIIYILNRIQNFFYCLKIFRFIRETTSQVVHYFFYFHCLNVIGVNNIPLIP